MFEIYYMAQYMTHIQCRPINTGLTYYYATHRNKTSQLKPKLPNFARDCG